MRKRPAQSEPLTDYLRRLQNPYAKLQVTAGPDSELRPLTEAERDYVRRLENPYAPLSVGVRQVEQETIQAAEASPRATVRHALSKAGFRNTCRRVFRHYIPQFEKGHLRRHHRDFIARNESRSPGERYKLAKHLEKYDLSEVPGIETRFNRERDELTEEKLRNIERTVLGLKD